MSSSTDQIKAKLDIVSVVGGYIKLEKAGSNFKARCPFHNEKTPSFFVSPDRGSYYCFGCQAKGDIFTFVQEFEGLDFKGALKILAERAGVRLENVRPEERTDTDALFSVMEQATFYFQKNLEENKEAQSYLKSRGVSKETITSFRLGYALAEWRGVHDFLLSKNVTVADMERAGLVKRKDGSVGHYDTFRSRIIFPIADSSGRIVAFSGRLFPEPPKVEAKGEGSAPTAPKYLNSPETPIFKKSEVLYGLDRAKKEIHSRDYSILVEGQMDLIMLYQTGFANTVASSGTALTESHLVRLQRLSNRLIMAFDGDPAGFKAISRGAEIALGLGQEVKVAAMPTGSDPADMALHDKDGLIEVIKNSKHIISFVLDNTIASSKDSHAVSRKIVSDVLPFISRLASATEQSYFVKEINQKAGIKEDAVWEDLKKIKKSESSPDIKLQTAQEKILTDRSDIILHKLLGIVLWQSGKKPSDIDVSDLEKKITEIIGPDVFSKSKVMHFGSGRDALLFEVEAYYNGRDNLSSDVSELVANLAEEKLKKEFGETMILLHQAEVAKNTKEVARLLSECQMISNKLNKIKNQQ